MIHAQGLKKIEPLLDHRQELWGLSSRQSARMIVKGHDSRGDIKPPSLVHSLFDNGLMSWMDAIKKAEGNA